MRHIITAAAFCLLITGCKDFLDPYSQTEFTPTRAEQLSEMILSALPDPADVTEGHLSLTGGILDIITDDVKTRPTVPVMYPTDQWYALPYVSAVQGLYTWRSDYSQSAVWNPEYMRWDEVYVNAYYKLTYVNSALDYLDKVSGTEREKNNVRAQALALRGLYYLNLVNIYGEPWQKGEGGMGVPIRLTGAKENRLMVRNTVGEVYARIVDDLTTAIAIFDALPEEDRTHPYRPTLPMSLMLLARTYLYMENWEQAATYAKRLLDDYPEFKVKNLNELITGNYTNFTPGNEARQLFWPDFKTDANPENIWVYGAAADVATLTGEDMDGARAQRGFYHAFLTQASDELKNAFDANDLRLRTYLVRDMYAWGENGSSTDPSTFDYLAYGKLAINQNADGVADNNFRFLPATSNRDFGYALRVSEAWLILAEARAEQGDDAGALAALGEIQSKRFAGGAVPAAYTTGDVIQRVREERRRELCFESLRWFDLRRWGMPEIHHRWQNTQRGSQSDIWTDYVLTEGDAGYTLPMPEDIMVENVDMTQVPVNNSRNSQ